MTMASSNDRVCCCKPLIEVFKYQLEAYKILWEVDPSSINGMVLVTNVSLTKLLKKHCTDHGLTEQDYNMPSHSVSVFTQTDDDVQVQKQDTFLQSNNCVVHESSNLIENESSNFMEDDSQNSNDGMRKSCSNISLTSNYCTENDEKISNNDCNQNLNDGLLKSTEHEKISNNDDLLRLPSKSRSSLSLSNSSASCPTLFFNENKTDLVEKELDWKEQGQDNKMDISSFSSLLSILPPTPSSSASAPSPFFSSMTSSAPSPFFSTMTSSAPLTQENLIVDNKSNCEDVHVDNTNLPMTDCQINSLKDVDQFIGTEVDPDDKVCFYCTLCPLTNDDENSSKKLTTRSSRNSQRMHICKAHFNKSLFCTDCSRVFSDGISLENHDCLSQKTVQQIRQSTTVTCGTSSTRNNAEASTSLQCVNTNSKVFGKHTIWNEYYPRTNKEQTFSSPKIKIRNLFPGFNMEQSQNVVVKLVRLEQDVTLPFKYSSIVPKGLLIQSYRSNENVGTFTSKRIRKNKNCYSPSESKKNSPVVTKKERVKRGRIRKKITYNSRNKKKHNDDFAVQQKNQVLKSIFSKYAYSDDDY